MTLRCSNCNLPIERGEIVHETRDHQPRHAKCCECVGREKGDRRAPVYRVVDGERYATGGIIPAGSFIVGERR